MSGCIWVQITNINFTFSSSFVRPDIDVQNLIISKLKRGKNDGFDGLSSDLIFNGTELYCHHLSNLFSLV